MSPVSLIASGGSTARSGGAGTVYLKSSADGTDRLVVDNRGIDAGEDSTELPWIGKGVITDLTADTLTASGANWQPGSLKGMRFVPDVTQSRYFTVIDNGATTLRIDPSEGDLTQVAARGSNYAGTYILTGMTVTGKARLKSYDPFIIRDDLVVDGATFATTSVGAGRLTVKNGGMLTQPRTTTTKAYSLELNVNNIYVEALSKIDVSGRGYLGGYSGGNNTSIGRTNLNTNSGGSNGGSGGSYGGSGGWYSGAVNSVYGDPVNPNEVGSGGGTEYSTYPSGNGGGLLRIKAGTLQLEGNILADGGSGSTVGGGGSGGGIRIDAGVLSGAGNVFARGGWADNGRGGGGGGRIAIYSETMTLPQANVSASGAATGHNGAAGTVHFSLL